MKKLLVILLLLSTPCFAQSSATQTTPGYLTTSGCPGGSFSCFQPYSSTNPLSVAVIGTSGATTGYVYTSNGPGVAATFQPAQSGSVASFSAGTTGLTPNSATSGAITLAGTLAVANGGTGLTSVTANQCLQGNSGGTALQYGSCGGGSGTVTSVTFTGDGTVLSSTPSAAVTATGTLNASLATQTANTILGATSTTLSRLAVPSCSATGSSLAWTTGTGLSCNTHVGTFSGDGTLLNNSSSTGAVTDTLANAGAYSVWGNNTSSSAAPSYQTAINVSGNIQSTTTTASTSGTQQQVSPIIAVNGTWWNGSTGTNTGYTQMTYTPDGNSGFGLFNIKMDGDNTGNHEGRFVGSNTFVDAVNKNDNLGAAFGEAGYNTALFGLHNTSGSAIGSVSANSSLWTLSMFTNGEVCTSKTSAPPVSCRNIIDDGTGSAHMAFKGSSPTVSACGTSPSIDTYASDNSGKVTVGSGTVASCTITFSNAYGTENHCRVTPETASLGAFGYSYSLSAITVTATSLTSAVFDYSCDGY